MDNKRLPLFIAISLAILLVSQWLMPRRPTPPTAPLVAQSTRSTPADRTPPVAHDLSSPGSQPEHVSPPTDQASRQAPRLAIDAPRVEGSLSLLGARLDDLRLRDYHETVDPHSPLVRLLEPAYDPQPSYIEFGWVSAQPGVKLPDATTLWTAAAPLTPGHPAALAWDNGAGLTFHIDLAIDADYLFTVRQWVHNATAAPVQLAPWTRVRRDYLPQATAAYGAFEGLIGFADGAIHSSTYANAKSEAAKHGEVAFQSSAAGGWAGFTDKYWLTAAIPDQALPAAGTWRHWLDGGADRFQVDYTTAAAQTAAPGADLSTASRLFVGAKEVRLLDRYESQAGIPRLSYAVDWGWLSFLTRPFFYTIDWFFSLIGNFGLAILLFTLLVKILFYPIAARSYRSMGKMRLLGPKITAVRERYKDDPAKQQSEMMAVYKAEQVNPVSGCLPMLIQIPVFLALYKVISVTIEMRHAPFFGWVRDLSVVDPTNVFNLFGLIPFDPSGLSPFLHLGVWPLIMGSTMYLQQKLNPPPPDPAQARMMQFMPLIFLFIMGRSPAGLVIYWSWNNALSILQQWYIQRSSTLGKARA